MAAMYGHCCMVKHLLQVYHCDLHAKDEVSLVQMLDKNYYDSNAAGLTHKIWNPRSIFCKIFGPPEHILLQNLFPAIKYVHRICSTILSSENFRSVIEVS